MTYLYRSVLIAHTKLGTRYLHLPPSWVQVVVYHLLVMLVLLVIILLVILVLLVIILLVILVLLVIILLVILVILALLI